MRVTQELTLESDKRAWQVTQAREHRWKHSEREDVKAHPPPLDVLDAIFICSLSLSRQMTHECVRNRRKYCIICRQWSGELDLRIWSLDDFFLVKMKSGSKLPRTEVSLTEKLIQLFSKRFKTQLPTFILTKQGSVHSGDFCSYRDQNTKQINVFFDTRLKILTPASHVVRAANIRFFCFLSEAKRQIGIPVH